MNTPEAAASNSDALEALQAPPADVTTSPATIPRARDFPDCTMGIGRSLTAPKARFAAFPVSSADHAGGPMRPAYLAAPLRPIA